MRELPHEAYSRHSITGIVLAIITGLCFAVLVYSVIIRNVAGAVVFGIMAMIFGKYAFDSFERAAIAKPDPGPTAYEINLLSAEMKNGDEVSVMMEIHYLTAKEYVYAPTRINAELQLRLNTYLRTLTELPEDVFVEIDTVLQAGMGALKRELGLDRPSLKVMDVKVGGIARPSQGIYFGEIEP